MSGMIIGARRSRRSGKLRREAGNCLAIALRETQPDMAALLIDEAVKLATRARALGSQADGVEGGADRRDARLSRPAARSREDGSARARIPHP